MSSLLSPDASDYFSEVQRWLGAEFNNINDAKTSTESQIKNLADVLASGRLIPDDASFVVFGSLARCEWTSKSDLDWSLLIDGAVDPAHVKMVHKINDAMEILKMKGPGREAIFGNLSFSHDLIHHIGGQDDTNKNLTKRILMLLESRVIGDEQAFERVVRAILERYCEEDSHLYSKEDNRFKVPRFLLNDVVRFWRTMAVDYVSKRRERNSKGWALRNVKLRLSRKLLFVSGVLMCLQCQLQIVRDDENDHPASKISSEPLIGFLAKFVERTPIDIVCEVLLNNNVKDTALGILSSYDSFLEILNDEDKRRKLEDLPYEEADASDIFLQARNLGYEFQKNLEKLFFVDNSELAKLTQTYGMF